MTIGEQVRKYRNLKKWKLKELSERSGLAISTLSDIELGKNESVKALREVARALGIDLDYLFKKD